MMFAARRAGSEEFRVGVCVRRSRLLAGRFRDEHQLVVPLLPLGYEVSYEADCGRHVTPGNGGD